MLRAPFIVAVLAIGVLLSIVSTGPAEDPRGMPLTELRDLVEAEWLSHRRGDPFGVWGVGLTVRDGTRCASDVVVVSAWPDHDAAKLRRELRERYGDRVMVEVRRAPVVGA